MILTSWCLSVSLVTKWGQETSWLFFLLVWFQGAKVHTFPDESTTWTLENSVLDTWEFQSWRRRWWWRTQWTGASSRVLSLRETWASQLKTQRLPVILDQIRIGCCACHRQWFVCKFPISPKKLFFTRPLPQKGSSLQEETLSVCLSVCPSSLFPSSNIQ